MANAVVTVLEADGVTETNVTVLDVGRQAAAASKSLTLSTEDFAVLDGLETAIASTNTKLDTLAGYLDGVETAIASTNTKLDTLDGRVDGLEAGVASTNSLLTAHSGYLDGVETAIAATNTKLDAANTSLDTIEAAAVDTVTESPVDIGADGSVTLLASSAAIGKLAANSGVDIGDVTVLTPCDLIEVTPTLDTSIYASGDVLFATTALTGAVRANDERAVLMSVAVIDKDDQKPAMRLLFFKANVTSGAFNGPPSITDTDAGNYLGHIDIAAADYADLGGVSVTCVRGINLLLESVSGGTTVYCFAYLTAGTPTHTASGLLFKFGVIHS